MPRPTNHDKKIADLISQLRRALVARESAKIEETVDAQMDGLVAGLTGARIVGNGAVAPVTPTAAPTTKKRRSWTPAAKKAAKARMKAWWAARRKTAKK